ncbi:MAG TPA: glycosyltransferase family 1 protein [Actinomycetota bacterium]|nr:glycosyltransferase family 1 protein [Actinomycetota bacterium]
MRLAIDARPALDPRRTGVGHYTRQIVRALPAAAAPDEVVAWYLDPSVAKRRRFDDVDAPNFNEHANRFPPRLFQPFTWRAGWPRLESLVGFDALLGPNFLPPPTASSGVVLVVHDLAFEVLPDTAPHHDDRWRRRFAEWLDRCAGVIVPSESTGRDLLEHHELDDDRVHVIPHGAEPFEAPPSADVDAVRSRFAIGGPYALFVGSIEPRKNLERLVRAFERLGEADAWLVIAGGRTDWIPGEAERLAVQVRELPNAIHRRVVLAGYVDERERRALVAGATALAYPSRYEGFGFPVLEAFAAGVPVLTSSVSSLPEVAGEAALLVDPDDVDAIADGLRTLFDDPGLRDRLVAAGRERARSFTWGRSAARTADVLRAAARR